jgi:hypothetical protein
MKYEFWIMLVSSILAGFGSTMNMWADKWEDISFSLNDVYMTGIMIGWMFFFMGLFMMHFQYLIGGAMVVLFFFMAIRLQLGIGQREYLSSMIPHHSMAIMMTKRMQQKPNTIQRLLENIIQTQGDEIRYMKNILLV